MKWVEKIIRVCLITYAVFLMVSAVVVGIFYVGLLTSGSDQPVAVDSVELKPVHDTMRAAGLTNGSIIKVHRSYRAPRGWGGEFFEAHLVEVDQLGLESFDPGDGSWIRGDRAAEEVKSALGMVAAEFERGKQDRFPEESSFLTRRYWIQCEWRETGTEAIEWFTLMILNPELGQVYWIEAIL